MNLGLYFHTLRHLRAVQFYGRIRHRLFKPNPNQAPPPQLRPQIIDWVQSPCAPQSLIDSTCFVFLNESHEITSSTDWDKPEISKLWRYNLHYFDDLVSTNSKSRSPWHQNIMDRWINENPAGFGTGWEPYPLSVRIVNWIKFSIANRQLLSANQLASLATQIRMLTKRLEWHLLGNHLLANAKALVFAGLYFKGLEADFWRNMGLKILANQLPEQILSDGGHYERSPMYQSIILTDLLDLINLYEAFEHKPQPLWRSLAARMGGWLTSMTHPDGGLSFFNDSAFGIAPSLKDLIAYADHLGITFDTAGANPKISGYRQLKIADATLIVDTAPIGPDFLPGHAHADTLSFEFSLGGRRLFVNSGTSIYGASVERERQRDTASHNTIKLDGVSSSEVWHGFRVAKRAYPFDITAGEIGAIAASHSGYWRLHGSPTHRRSWSLNEGQLNISDQITGSGIHQIQIFFYLHPDWKAVASGSTKFHLINTIGKCSEINLDPILNWRLETSTWHPYFGVAEENLCIIGERTCSLPVHFNTRVEWPCEF